MPAPLIPKDEVLERIFGVFRTYGYEGATLARLSESTGLGRASLYHYFPGGKDEMAKAVLETARGWLTQAVVGALEGPGTPEARIRKMIRNLRTGYADGRESCVINLLGVGEADQKFHDELDATIELWLRALERTLTGAGIKQKQARRAAIDMLVRIEGSLIVARALGDTGVFLRALDELEAQLTGVLSVG